MTRSLSSPSHALHRRRFQFHSRRKLPTVWEEDWLQFTELWRNRLQTDFAFRELLFGHYTRKYSEQRDHACAGLAICHFQTFLRQFNAKQQVAINTLPLSSSPESLLFSYVTIRNRHLSFIRVAKSFGTRSSRDSSPVLSTNSQSTLKSPSPLLASLERALHLHDDIEAFANLSRPRRYWIYLRFMFRHCSLPEPYAALTLPEQELYRQMKLLEHFWFQLVGDEAADFAEANASASRDSASSLNVHEGDTGVA